MSLHVEDTERSVTLDSLEMQFYREVAVNADFENFLEQPTGTVRSGQSCRDVTARIPQDLVALYAAIGSRAIKEALASDQARLLIWREGGEAAGEQSIVASRSSVYPRPVSRHAVGDWTVSTDKGLIEKLAQLRDERLPNETGGVLIGNVDLARKLVHVVECLPSPSDSEEYPAMYIRGSEGLEERVKRISGATAGMLSYVGEWHSHPNGATVDPSVDDNKVLQWVRLHMATEGLPGLIAIAGDNEEVNFLIAPQDFSLKSNDD